MILAHCFNCRFHEKVELNNTTSSRCNKENCLAIYSNCVRVTAVKKFVSQDTINELDDQSSALEICYPLA